MIGDDNKLWYPGYKANTHIPWSDNNHHSQHMVIKYSAVKIVSLHHPLFGKLCLSIIFMFVKMGDEECSGFRSLSNLLY